MRTRPQYNNDASLVEINRMQHGNRDEWPVSTVTRDKEEEGQGEGKTAAAATAGGSRREGPVEYLVDGIGIQNHRVTQLGNHIHGGIAIRDVIGIYGVHGPCGVRRRQPSAQDPARS